jgi:hypothetical protein
MENKDYFINKFEAQGYIAGEVRLTGTKSKCCSVQLAIEESGKKGLPDYIPLRFWNAMAEIFVANHKKGDFISITAKMRGGRGKDDVFYVFAEVKNFSPVIVPVEIND